MHAEHGCWPVHEAILGIVIPKLIIAFGNSVTSPYAYFSQILGGSEESLPSRHGDWRVEGSDSQINRCSVYVAGLPHLSCYTPIGKGHVVEWLRKNITIRSFVYKLSCASFAPRSLNVSHGGI